MELASIRGRRIRGARIRIRGTAARCPARGNPAQLPDGRREHPASGIGIRRHGYVGTRRISHLPGISHTRVGMGPSGKRKQEAGHLAVRSGI
jgi:hypothetical protein